MKKTVFLSLALVAILPLMVSCQREPQDNERPTVELIAPKEGAKLKIGGKHGVHFEMNLRDNVMLKSYKIEIHNNFDNHSHETKTLRHGDEKPFFFQKEYDLSGKKEDAIHHHDIVIPENAAEGKYHLLVQVLDAAGNQTTVARNIELTHDAEEHHHHHHE